MEDLVEVIMEVHLYLISFSADEEELQHEVVSVVAMIADSNHINLRQQVALHQDQKIADFYRDFHLYLVLLLVFVFVFNKNSHFNLINNTYY